MPRLTRSSATCTLVPVLTRSDDRLTRQEAAREHYAARAKSPATERAYTRQWGRFVAYCAEQDCESLPASSGHVADYVIACAERGLSGSSIRQILSAIAHQHALSGYPSPALHPQLRTVVQGVLREHARPIAEAEPLLPEDVRKLITVLDPGIRGIRDLSLLTFGVASGMRRSELSLLQFEHIRRERDGIIVFLPRSKTDQYGEGHRRKVCRGQHLETCPVSALDSWIGAAGIESGPVFRPLSRWGTVFDKHLSTRRIDEIVRELTRRVIDKDPNSLPARRYSAHSLRAGLCTAAALAGKPEHEIRAHVDHSSAQSTARYIRLGRVRQSTVTSGIGL